MVPTSGGVNVRIILMMKRWDVKGVSLTLLKDEKRAPFDAVHTVEIQERKRVYRSKI